MKEAILSNPFFGISITIIGYALGVLVNKLLKKDFVTPLAIAFIFIIAVLLIFRIPVEYYEKGGSIISMFNVPIVALLSLKIYRERKELKKNFIPVIVGTVIGSAASIGSILLLAKLLKLEPSATASILSKSVTAPIAVAITNNLGGIEGITMYAVLITGLFGSIFSPLMVKIFGVKDHVAQGIAIGSSSHALGTAKALSMGEDIGAASGIALTLSGIVTALFSLLFV